MKNSCIQNTLDAAPYLGLRPYMEENRHIFFGREPEKIILIDKLLANKLSLLFAATGVGKSSLLQAAVMPELKRPEKMNLDVVYYFDWVSNPLEKLKEKTVQMLHENGKVGFDHTVEGGASLKDFFQLCSTFSSEPLVIILDQFEEFFQYRKYREGYRTFIRELSEAIKDNNTPVVFVISMREDFALELNAFKEYLCTTLFEHYFRLEKLSVKNAKDAICKPVERLGFQYEEKLWRQLLVDLADRETWARRGGSSVQVAKGAPTSMEPPYLQIVCTQLWEVEKENPDNVIRFDIYDKNGRAKGFVDSYFNEVMDRFSHSGKRIASQAFNHLITPHGTKMAYPVKDLAHLLRVAEKALEKVLEKLLTFRILRSQKREGQIWYELYHDIFSDIIYAWNETFKSKERIKRVTFRFAAVVLVFLIIFVANDIISNLNNRYLQISLKTGPSARLEINRGKINTLDILDLKEYKIESVYKRSQLSPDKVFSKKQISNPNKSHLEIIGNLPIVKRISAYLETGEIDKALELADKSITGDDISASKKIISILSGLGSIESYRILKKHMQQSKSIAIRQRIIESAYAMGSSLVRDDIISLLGDENETVKKKPVRF